MMNAQLKITPTAARGAAVHSVSILDPDGKVIKLLDLTNRGGDVADPWYTGNFEITYRDITEGCDALITKILISK